MNKPRALSMPMLAPAPAPALACILAWGLMLFNTGAAMAQKIYKSLDADGVVSYSSTPPPDAPSDQVETVRVDPPPAEAERTAAQQRYSSMQPGAGRSQSRFGSPSAGQDEPTSTKAAKAGSSTTSLNQQTQTTRSGSRSSRPAGGTSSPERGRVRSQLPSARTSR